MFELYKSLFVHPLRCKCAPWSFLEIAELTPLVLALYFKVLLKSDEALFLEIRYRHSTQVRRCATISSLAPVVFCIIQSWTQYNTNFPHLPYLSGYKVSIMSSEDIVHTSSGVLIDYSWHHMLRVPVVGRLVACWKWRGRPTKCQLYPLKH